MEVKWWAQYCYAAQRRKVGLAKTWIALMGNNWPSINHPSFVYLLVIKAKF